MEINKNNKNELDKILKVARVTIKHFITQKKLLNYKNCLAFRQTTKRFTYQK